MGWSGREWWLHLRQRVYSHQLIISADCLRYVRLSHPHSLEKDKNSTSWEGEGGEGPKQLPLVLDLPVQKGHPLEEGKHLPQGTLPRWQCLLGWQAQGPWRSGPVAKPVWDFHQSDLESRKTGKGDVTFSGQGGGEHRGKVQAKTPAQECIWQAKGLPKVKCLSEPKNLKIPGKTFGATGLCSLST